MNKYIVIAALLTCCSCTYEAKVVDNGKTSFCVDARDNEKFSFKTSSMTNVRVGVLGEDTCVDVQLSTGEMRTLCKSQEVFIKCVSKVQ